MVFHRLRPAYDQACWEVGFRSQLDVADHEFPNVGEKYPCLLVALPQADLGEPGAAHQAVEAERYFPPDLDAFREVSEKQQIEDALVVGRSDDRERDDRRISGGVGEDVDNVEVAPGDVVVVASPNDQDRLARRWRDW